MPRKRLRSNTRFALLVLTVIAAFFVWMEARKKAPSTSSGPNDRSEQVQRSSEPRTADQEADEATRSPDETEDTEASPSDISIYFSDTYRNDPSIGEQDPDNIDRHLASFIGSARRTLDCAFFELESKRIANALIAAHKRGVRVRLVGDADYKKNSEMVMVIDAGIPVVFDERSALMHDKFAVVDGASVWTGSFNATDNGAFRNNNNAVMIRSRELAENYSTEFAEMFDRHEFGPTSTANTPHTLVRVGTTDVYNYFSPEDDVPPKIIRYLRAARKSIHFMAFSFSDDEIGSTLIEKHREGIDVQGVFESRGSSSAHSEMVRLQPAGVRTWKDGNKYVMHHKVFIIDGVWTITGSYNFTASAAKQNDENIVIIKNSGVAQRFEEEYQRIRKMAQPAS